MERIISTKFVNHFLINYYYRSGLQRPILYSLHSSLFPLHSLTLTLSLTLNTPTNNGGSCSRETKAKTPIRRHFPLIPPPLRRCIKQPRRPTPPHLQIHRRPQRRRSHLLELLRRPVRYQLMGRGLVPPQPGRPFSPREPESSRLHPHVPNFLNPTPGPQPQAKRVFGSDSGSLQPH